MKARTKTTFVGLKTIKCVLFTLFITKMDFILFKNGILFYVINLQTILWQLCCVAFTFHKSEKF